jgi:hexosaminidase
MVIALLISMIFGGVASTLCAGDHNAVLPAPQQIQYGSGQVLVRGLAIQLPSSPTAEDAFAGNTLSTCLAERAASPVPIAAGNPAARLIAMERTGPVGALPVPGDQPGPDSREAYWLSVKPSGISLRAGSTAGLFYAAQTLCQLVEGRGATAAIPEVEIHDWPALAYRGVMIDMSHGPLPTEDEIKRQLDFLARWKGNQYYFYSEASIELAGYPLLNPHGRFTQDQIHRLVAYGRARHVDVIPCLELYGHLHDLFRVEKYSDLADIPHGTEFDPRNPKVMALLTDWAAQFTAMFPSPFVHIGFDETFQIEIAAREPGKAASPARLFIQQLSDVARLFQKQGKTVMAWGDIMVKYPEITKELPPGMVAVAWEYDPVGEAKFQHWLGPLVANHIPHMIATGVTSWNQISPDFVRSFANIDSFLASARKSHALGMMNTIWADDAQMLMRTTWPGMAYGAAAAWQSGPMDTKHFFTDYARLAYVPDAAADVAAALDDLAQAEVAIQKVIGDDSMLQVWNDPFKPAMMKTCAENLPTLHRERFLAEDAEENLDRALAAGGDALTLGPLLFESRLLDYAGKKFQTAPELDDMWKRLKGKRPDDQTWWNEWESQTTYQDHSRVIDLMDAITELREQYRNEWLSEYTPYRLESALGRWDAEYEYWRQAQAKFIANSNSTKEGDALPPLSTVVDGK